MLHVIRASLFAKAVASLLRWSRGAAFRSHAPKLKRSQLCGRIRMTFAAWMNRVLRYLLPRLEMRPRIDRPPVLYWRGTRPSHAPKSRPRSNASPAPMAATTAVEISGPMPGTLMRRWQLASFSPIWSISLAGKGLDPLIDMYPVFVETYDQIAHSRRYLVLPVLQDCQERVPQSSRPSLTAMPC